MADPSQTTRATSAPAPEGDEVEESSKASEGSAELVGAIRELSARVGNLQAEVQTLRTQSRSLPAPGAEAGWDDGRSGPDLMTWVRALDAPAARVPAVPRLLLEIVFLVAVAVGAAIAELDVVEIAVVMGVAWLLVAGAELAAARAARQRAEAAYAPLPGFAHSFVPDQAWFAPPVERTMLDDTSPGEDTQARLPPPSDD